MYGNCTATVIVVVAVGAANENKRKKNTKRKTKRKIERKKSVKTIREFDAIAQNYRFHATTFNYSNE